MRMSTALINGSEAENHGHKQSLSDMVGSHFESAKMKNISVATAEFEKLISSRVSESEDGNNDEMFYMRELLLIHLDYIQQQSEQLDKTDKQLEELRAENEMLKQRLARIERRVSLQKTRIDKKQQTTTSTAATSETPETSTGRKRRATETASAPQATSTRRAKQESDENENEPAISLDSILTTRMAYYTVMGDEQKWRVHYVKRPRKEKTIENPSWRIKTFTSTYTMEGTENLSDDVFERRHYKLMVDEKKRKRWDVQRIREQRQIEKLKSREGGDKNQVQPCKSLWPKTGEEGLRLSVTPLIPVSAFGINLPSVSIQDFTLPWKDGVRHVSSRKRSKR